MSQALSIQIENKTKLKPKLMSSCIKIANLFFEYRDKLKYSSFCKLKLSHDSYLPI